MQASPISLATTFGISVDFCSSAYLDVSVQQVRSTHPMYSGEGTLAGGFPHSEIPGSKLVCQLPEAYRRLPRPSSPVIAKASTICAYSLDHITPNRLAVSCRSTRHRSHLELHGAGFIANATYPDPAHGPITRPCGGIHLRQALRI